MQEDELRDAWARMLEGELSAQEDGVVGRSLESLDEAKKDSLKKDLQHDRLLREIYQPDDHPADEQFVSRVMEQIGSCESPTSASTLGATTEPFAAPPKYVSPPLQTPNPASIHWLYATVASITLVIGGVSYMLRAGRIPTRSQAVRDAKTNLHPERIATTPAPNGASANAERSDISNLAIDDIDRKREILADSDNQIADPIRVDPSESPASNKVVVAPSTTIHSVEPPGSPESPESPKSLAPKKPTIRLAPGVSQSATQPVATFTKTDNVVWGAGGPPDDLSQPVDLVSGTATIKLDQGAEVEVSGPAQLQVQGPNQVQLTLGSIQARVPPSAVGFEVKAPGARIVDLGTEFTVRSAPKDKYTSVRVTKGRVEVFQRALNHRARERRTEIATGQTKWFTKRGSERPVDWLLPIKFEFGDFKPGNKIFIADTEYDPRDPESAQRLKQDLDDRFAIAHQQFALLDRGTRFNGLLVVNWQQQTIGSKRQLVELQSFLLEQIQLRINANRQDVSPMGMIQEFQKRMRGLLSQ